MAIIHMMGNTEYANGQRQDIAVFPAGAYCPIGDHSMNNLARKSESDWGKNLSDTEYLWHTAIILYKTHHGLCLYEREMNGYHDSDFYMTVWNPEKKAPEEIMFASTRGWTYPCYGSAADASPEVWAEFEAWQKYQARRQSVLTRWETRRKGREARAKAGITLQQYKRLCGCGYSRERVEECLKLLSSTRLRNSFRINMQKQLRDWINDSAPKFSRPFSPRQADYVFGFGQ